MKFVSTEAQNFSIVAAILNTTQQPGRVFVTSFRPRDFVQMASDKPFSYHSELWLLLSQIILSQHVLNSESDSSEEVKWIIAWKKYILLTL